MLWRRLDFSTLFQRLGDAGGAALCLVLLGERLYIVEEEEKTVFENSVFEAKLELNTKIKDLNSHFIFIGIKRKFFS